MGSKRGLPFCLRSVICQVDHYVDRAQRRQVDKSLSKDCIFGSLCMIKFRVGRRRGILLNSKHRLSFNQDRELKYCMNTMFAVSTKLPQI